MNRSEITERPLQATHLQTQGLSLEPLTPGHADRQADEMQPVLADPVLYAFTGGEPPTMETLRQRYKRQALGVSPDQSDLWLNWIIRLDQAAVGYVQATVANEATPRTAEVAWVIGSPWQGQGIAGRAAILMTDWLTNMGISRVTAHIHPEHLASASVAAKIGLHPQAVFTDEGEQLWARP